MKYFLFAMLAFAFISCKEDAKVETNDPVETNEVIDVITYHDNGVIEKKGKSLNGKRIGTWEAYYTNGYKWSIVNYRDGLKWGETMAFFPNGMMKWQGQYSNDERTGLWIFYDTTGVVLKRIDMDQVDFSNDSIPN